MNFFDAMKTKHAFKYKDGPWLRWNEKESRICEVGGGPYYDELSIDELCDDSWTSIELCSPITLTLDQFRKAVRRAVDEQMLLEDILFP